MPKLYEYFGITIMFYSNEHEPVHVHGKFQGFESRAEIFMINGVVAEIRYTEVAGRAPLPGPQARFFQEIVQVKAADIVNKWVDYFVFNKSFQAECIMQRVK